MQQYQKNLTIGGTIGAQGNNENLNVHYSGTTGEISSTKTGATLSATTDENLTATISASGLDTKGQTVTAVFTVVNDSTDLGADLAAGTKQITGTDSSYFEVTSVTFGKTHLNAKGTGTADSTTVTVVLTLTTTPIDTISGTIDITLTATATA